MVMVWFENPVLREREGSSAMSANQDKHSAYRSKSCICVFVLTWLEHFYPHGDAGAATCKPLLDERYRAQIVQKCMLSVSYLCHESLYSQTTHGWNSIKHLFTTSGSRVAWRPLLALMLAVSS